MPTPKKVTIRQGNKSAAWFTANAGVILKDGQIVYLDDDSGHHKKGDNTRVLSALPWLGVDEGGTVTSVNDIQPDEDGNVELTPSDIGAETAGAAAAALVIANAYTDLKTANTTLIFKDNAPISHTGDTVETKVRSFLIPGGRMNATDLLRIMATVTTPFAGGVTKHFRVKLNTIDNHTSASGAVQIALYTFTSSSQKFQRTIKFNSLTSQEVTVATTSHATDESVIVAQSDFTSLSFNFNNDVWVIFTIELTNSANSMMVKNVMGQVLR